MYIRKCLNNTVQAFVQVKNDRTFSDLAFPHLLCCRGTKREEKKSQYLREQGLALRQEGKMREF